MDVSTPTEEYSFTPPVHTIDLSLPPRQRYMLLAQKYRQKLNALTGMFDQLLLDLGLPPRLLPAINRLAKLFMRDVHASEQTEEIRGISQRTGISMYLLVSFNVVLDLLMGCTSGGVRCLERQRPVTEARMLHFRSLDWGMDGLRDIVVQLDFVRSKSGNPRDVVASSVTYVGFVGVLTGVKPGLSLSLNFRGVHDATTYMENIKFYLHHLLVLFGWQPSIASTLRSYLLSSSNMNLTTCLDDLNHSRTTAAYIILSDGRTTVTVEKDRKRAFIQRSETFIALTNHDILDHSSRTNIATRAADVAPRRNARGIDEIVEDSQNRLRCLRRKWEAKIRAARRTKIGRSVGRSAAVVEQSVSITKDELVKWLCDWPTTNESTHFAVIMDPTSGTVVWSRAYAIPLE